MGCISEQEINTVTRWWQADLVGNQSRLEHFIAVEIATLDLADLSEPF